MDFKELLSQLPIKEIAIGLALFGIGLWIVYRPDIKLKNALFEALGYSKPGPYQFNKNEIRKKWKAIEDSLDSSTLSSWKAAIEQVDELFNFVLEKAEPNASSNNERLDILRRKYTKLENLKPALLVRSRVLKENGFKVNYDEIKDAMRRFKEALRELGAL